MTTKEAFENLISQRAWYIHLGIPENTARSYSKRYRDGKLPTEKIEEILERAGYHVKQEKLWGNVRDTNSE
jgi:hypothetical protein